jgi:GDP-L-fucose synthase
MKKISKSSKIFLAGHKGLVGSSLLNNLRNQGFHNIITKTSKQLDLTSQSQVKNFFKMRSFDFVILAAARAGGIKANIDNKSEFIHNNLMIALNVINFSYENKIKNLIFFASNCIYPELSSQPIKEKYLLTGELEESISYYAMAKISGLKLCQAYNRQFNTNYRVVTPPNLFGVNDNFDLSTAHVLPALLFKFHNAKKKLLKSVNVWGDGKQTREFLYVEDLSNFIIYLMQNWAKADNYFVDRTYINVGTGKETSIKELSIKIADLVKYKGKIIFDKDQPTGTPRKVLDVSLVKKYGWKAKHSLEEGIKKTYKKKFNLKK